MRSSFDRIVFSLCHLIKFDAIITEINRIQKYFVFILLKQKENNFLSKTKSSGNSRRNYFETNSPISWIITKKTVCFLFHLIFTFGGDIVFIFVTVPCSSFLFKIILITYALILLIFHHSIE